jgi:hypothetical protein
MFCSVSLHFSTSMQWASIPASVRQLVSLLLPPRNLASSTDPKYAGLIPTLPRGNAMVAVIQSSRKGACAVRDSSDLLAIKLDRSLGS